VAASMGRRRDGWGLAEQQGTTAHPLSLGPLSADLRVGARTDRWKPAHGGAELRVEGPGG
jgi:hypothetical protein